MSKRAAGRNHRKRLIRQERDTEFYSASGQSKVKPDWAMNPPTDAEVAQRLRDRYLETHRKALDRCAYDLGSMGCWQYFETHLWHAKRLRYEREFRQLVVSAATRFMGRSVKTGYHSVG